VRFLREGEVEFDAYLSGLGERGGEREFRFQKRVRSILTDVRKKGDEAVIRYTRCFDNVGLRAEELEIDRKAIAEAYGKVPGDFLRTLKRAASRIRRFHRFKKRRQLPQRKGAFCSQRF